MHKFLSWTAVILWMSLIFYLSHQPAAESSELSDGITEVIIQTIEKVAPSANLTVEDFSHIVRKSAHFTYYLVLAILVKYALERSGVHGGRNILIALLICILYAISDEVHQLFVPGRSGEIRDVIIDSTGAASGILIYLGITSVRSRVRRRQSY